MSQRKGKSIAWLIGQMRKFPRAKSYHLGQGYISLFDRYGKHVVTIYRNGEIERTF